MMATTTNHSRSDSISRVKSNLDLLSSMASALKDFEQRQQKDQQDQQQQEAARVSPELASAGGNGKKTTVVTVARNIDDNRNKTNNTLISKTTATTNSRNNIIESYPSYSIEGYGDHEDDEEESSPVPSKSVASTSVGMTNTRALTSTKHETNIQAGRSCSVVSLNSFLVPHLQPQEGDRSPESACHQAPVLPPHVWLSSTAGGPGAIGHPHGVLHNKGVPPPSKQDHAHGVTGGGGFVLQLTPRVDSSLDVTSLTRSTNLGAGRGAANLASHTAKALNGTSFLKNINDVARSANDTQVHLQMLYQNQQEQQHQLNTLLSQKAQGPASLCVDVLHQFHGPATTAVSNAPTSSDLSSLLSKSASAASLSSPSSSGVYECDVSNSCDKCTGCGLLAAQALVVEQLQRENALLKQRLTAKDQDILSLTTKANELERHIEELRQLPTGKISQIPIEDMLDIMREYGSEVSETAVVPRKETVQKASVVRQFRRWNPNFFTYFQHKNGKWTPKLGKKGELERRARVRKESRTAVVKPADSKK